MTTNELKAIGDLVEQKIESALRPVKAELSSHGSKLDTLEAKMDSHTVSLMNIEQTLSGYADMYKVNKDNNVDLDERVTKIETHLGIPFHK